MKIKDTPIHILVSPATNPRMSTLVFETIRKGFPENPISVNVKEDALDVVSVICEDIEIVDSATTHWDWIDSLVIGETGPFFICDTDMIFHKDCTELFEQPEPALPFAGEFVPGHIDIHTAHYMVQKYHPSLLWINGPAIRPLLQRDAGPACNIAYSARPFVCQFDGHENYFDTLAHLQRKVGGWSVDGTGYWDHLHCGTWSQYIKGEFGVWLRDAHEKILAGTMDPGVIRQQYQQYLKARRAYSE